MFYPSYKSTKFAKEDLYINNFQLITSCHLGQGKYRLIQTKA